VQSFFAKILKGGFFDHADPDSGRLRSFLLKSFQHHLIGEHRADSAERRGGGVAAIDIDAERGEHSGAWQIASLETPENAYQHRWACALLESCMDQLETEYRSAGKALHYAALHPLLCAGTGASAEQAARELDCRPGALRVALHRLRKRLGEIFEAEVKATLLPDENAKQEIRCLMDILARKRDTAHQAGPE